VNSTLQEWLAQAPCIVSTDLDGTLLDHHSYSWQEARPAIARLTKHAIPIIFNTSKTLSEARALQHSMGISGPVIVENGSAMVFTHDTPTHFFNHSTIEPQIIAADEKALLFGTTRQTLLQFIKQQRDFFAEALLEGYNDWSIAQICESTGLSESEAIRASEKLFSEPFVWTSDKNTFEKFEQAANAEGFNILQGGRFFHLQGDTNKSKPLQWLKKIREDSTSSSKHTPLICLGDNKNDIHMLNIADYPVCIKSPTTEYPTIHPNEKCIFTQEYGPKGWQHAIATILDELKI